MGIVSDYLRDLLQRQVDEKRLVVWFDPDGHYSALAETLTLPDTTIARYDGSFFALRRQISPQLDAETPPRLLVYAPLAEERTRDALIELTAAGVTLKPGQQPWQRNTRLSVVARAALKDAFGPEHLKLLERQIEAGQLATLDEVDTSIERMRQQADPGVIALIFDSSDPEEVALSFLSDDRHDQAISAKAAQRDLAALLGGAFGLELSSSSFPSLSDLRAQFARHVLSTDLLALLHPPVPAQLATVRVAHQPAQRDACLRLARRWRHDRDLADAYARSAGQVEGELSLAAIPFTIEQTRDCHTFAAIERALAAAVERACIAQPAPEWLTLADARLRGFWAQRQPEMQSRWALVASAGQLLLRAAQIEAALKQPGHQDLTAASLINRYTTGDAPWRQLDTFHRQLEQRSRRFDFTADHETLDQLLGLARRRYMDVGDQLAVAYTRALLADDVRLSGFMRQRDIVQRVVLPALREGKTAYLLVDALRYEMACELTTSLDDGFAVQLDAAIASAPTITEIGMASLMPGLSGGLSGGGSQPVEIVSSPTAGKLALRVGDALLHDRASRLEWLHAWFRAHAPTTASGGSAQVADTKLDDLLALKPQLKSTLSAADLILVTADEIDAVAEMDNISLARALMDQLLEHLTRGIRRLVDLGCHKIVIVADHGYLFTEELDSAMKIDPPGGQTLDLHRRVWVGRGGASSSAYLRAPLAAFGFGPSDPASDPASDLELAAPWGFGAFKAPGGARAYFHGGLSLPEMIIPVATLAPTAPSANASLAGEIEWTLALGSRRITTRTCSVTIGGRRQSLFAVEPPPVRVEIHAGNQLISAPRFATYGLNSVTQEIQPRFSEQDDTELEPSTIMLEIDPERAQRATVAISLLDARTGQTLKQLDDIELRIAIQ